MAETQETVVVGRALTLVGIIVGLFVITSSWVNIPAGYRGVVFNKLHGGVQQGVLGEGYNFRTPLITYVREYPVGLRTYSAIGAGEGSDPSNSLVSLPTAGGQHVEQQMSVTYHVSPDKVNFVFDQFKGADIEDIETGFIRRNVQSVATAITGTYDLLALGPQKSEIQGKIQKALAEKLAPYGFTVDQVNLGLTKFPESIEAALQKKMAAEQEADQAQYGLQKAEMDSKAKIATAEGEAKANSLIKQQLTPEFIRYQALDVQKLAIGKWDGHLPTSMPPNGTVPFLNVNANNTKGE